MAMEATHIRFARDLATSMRVTDFVSYYSGAVYPDSRYATGVPRFATHLGASCPRDLCTSDMTDFEKGWATHLCYDRTSAAIRRETLVGIPDEWRADDWAFATAVKLVEDMESVRALGADIALARNLVATEHPCGEDLRVMERYYADLCAAYASACDDPEDYRAFSIRMGIASVLADRMIALARNLAADSAILRAIAGVYPCALTLAETALRR
jgi:hypothetical protein